MMLKIMSLVFSLVALTYCVKTYIVVKKRDIKIGEDFKKYNKKKKELFLIEELQNKKEEILVEARNEPSYRIARTWNFNLLGEELDEKVKLLREEERYKEELLRTIADCINETVCYLKNPENYVSEKKIVMLQKKLSDEKRGSCNER